MQGQRRWGSAPHTRKGKHSHSAVGNEGEVTPVRRELRGLTTFMSCTTRDAKGNALGRGKWYQMKIWIHIKE